MSRTSSRRNSPSQEILFEEKVYTPSSSIAELVSDPRFSELKEELSNSIIQLKSLDLALSSFMKINTDANSKPSADLFGEISISEKSVASLKSSIHRVDDTFKEIEISLKA